MAKRKIIIGDKAYVLDFVEFDEEIDVDDVLSIDFSNLIGEMITTPILVNRVSMLLADMERDVAEAKINLEICEAKLKDKLRVQLAEQNGGKSPTVDALNNAVLLDKTYQRRKSAYLDAVRDRDYMNGLFWSLKDKSDKLNKLSLTIQDQEIPTSVIEGRVNGVLLKKGRTI